MSVATMSGNALRARQSDVPEADGTPHLHVIDVRSEAEFAGGSLPGARNVPLERIVDHAEQLRDLAGEVVLICRTGRRAHRAALTLTDVGIAPVSVLHGGLEGYAGSASSTDDVPAELPGAMRAGWGLERQVRLVAGTVVASSIVVSIWEPKARFLAGAVGAGLTVAALTDTCAMGSALAKLPFNRSKACSL